jgi:hypothetical protein
MNFRGHVTGGFLAGATVCTAAVASGYVPWDSDALEHFLDSPLPLEGAIPLLLGLFGVTVFMSLFPDLDTASVPQRWFYRIVFVLLGVSYFTGHHDLFAVVAFLSPLPLIHKHRGWTHWLITPWLIAMLLAAVHEYLRIKDSLFSGFQWEQVLELLQTYWLFVVACVIGHYMHLLLDSRSIRWLPFIRNESDHH